MALKATCNAVPFSSITQATCKLLPHCAECMALILPHQSYGASASIKQNDVLSHNALFPHPPVGLCTMVGLIYVSTTKLHQLINYQQNAPYVSCTIHRNCESFKLKIGCYAIWRLVGSGYNSYHINNKMDCL